jgi:ubiquinone/menaquinone biosynthesis C-methylase UbiE
MTGVYVHGYSADEENRLSRQAGILNPFIHDRATFPPGSRILEAGCGTGAQTLQLALRNPKARFVAIDLSMQSLQIARQRIETHSLLNVAFQQADLHFASAPCVRSAGC